ncbi:amidohydrolase family protein [Pontibacillus yanchengensis]|uniref:Amidohydrolase family protein n=1 Tax=Pontibacillus yanchengensis TaxID=462910 RepID=A0A6I5A423_9BACI|nr:amidohydrolase family protein [Pontibacillus yanchengensis]
MAILIKNAHIVTMSANQDVVEGHLLIEDGKIKKVFSYDEVLLVEGIEEVVDMEWGIVIPGMTNAHYHSYSNLLKGTENHFPLEIWSLYTVAYGHSLTDEDIYLAVLLGATEMIRAGVTGCLDHFPHLSKVNAALEAYEKSGLQVSFAPMMHDVPDHQFLRVPLPNHIKAKLEENPPKSVSEMRELYESLLSTWHKKHDRIHIQLGPNAPQRCTSEMLALCRELSATHDVKVHTHLLETTIQKQMGDQAFPSGIIGLLHEAGLLNERLSVAHAIRMNEKEVEQMQARGVKMIHNPASNMILGSGKAPIMEWFTKGMKVGLGTDASNCGTSHNLFETMRLAAMLHRLDTPDYTKWPGAKDVMKMATVDGASIMGDDNHRGKIEEGYDADLVFLTKQTTALTSLHDLHSQLVFHENGQSIEAVMIKGEWVLRNNKILTFDEQQVMEQAQKRHQQILTNSKEALEFAEVLKPYFEQYYNDFNL